MFVLYIDRYEWKYRELPRPSFDFDINFKHEMLICMYLRICICESINRCIHKGTTECMHVCILCTCWYC